MKFKELLLTFSSTLVTLLILFYFENYVLKQPLAGQREEGGPEKLVAKVTASKGKIVQSDAKPKAVPLPVISTISSAEAVDASVSPPKDSLRKPIDTVTVTPTKYNPLKAPKDIVVKVPIAASSVIQSKTADVIPVEANQVSSTTTGASSIRTHRSSSHPKQSYALDQAIQCAASVSQKYLSDSGTKNSANDVEWCKNAQTSFGVIFGKSFGTMPKDQQKKWEKLKCNELIKLGKHQSCDQRWGWGFFDNWLANTHKVVMGPGKLNLKKHTVSTAPTATLMQPCAFGGWQHT